MHCKSFNDSNFQPHVVDKQYHVHILWDVLWISCWAQDCCNSIVTTVLHKAVDMHAWHMGCIMNVQLSYYLVLLSIDSKTRWQDSRTSVTRTTWIITGFLFGSSGQASGLSGETDALGDGGGVRRGHHFNQFLLSWTDGLPTSRVRNH